MIKYLIAFAFTLLLYSFNYPVNKGDLAVREVLTGQHLFVIKADSTSCNGDTIHYEVEAQLRDAVKVVKYEDDYSCTELDWTLCPDGKCPTAGQFEQGSVPYNSVDSLISSANRL